MTTICTIRTSTSSFFSSLLLILSFSFFFFLFSFSWFFFFAFFFLSSFLSQRSSSRMRFSTKHDLELRRETFFRRKAKIDRDNDPKTFVETSEDVVHILINVALDRTCRDVDLQRLTSSIKRRQSIYNSTSDIFKNFHEIRESIELTSNNRDVFDLFQAFALLLFYQFSKKQHLAYSRDATNVILSKNDDDWNLLENLSRDDTKCKINLHWLIIDISSTDSRHFYNYARNIETFVTIANDTIYVENVLERRILDQKLDTFLTAFRFRILVENDFKRFRQWTIKFDNVEISRKRISHKQHHESVKKDFFE